VHSTYSLLEGAIANKDLAAFAAKYKMPAVAVADHGNLFGALEFAMAASAKGVQPIHACVCFFEHDVEVVKSNASNHPDQLLLIAQDETGWLNLMKLVSQSFLAPPAAYAPRLSMKMLEGHTDGLIALTGGIYGALGKHLLAGHEHKADEFLCQLKALFPNRIYIELMRHGLADEKRLEPMLVELALSHDVPLVATNDAYFISKDMHEAHDAFICIADGKYVGEDDRRRLTPEHRLKTPEEMAALFADIPEALANTVNIARRCSFYSQGHAPILPSFTDEFGNNDEVDILKREAAQGLEMRLQNEVFTNEMDDVTKNEVAKPYRERLQYELEVIINMRFPGYFLIVSDFIKWAKANGIPVGPGRGSGAGSLVAWALLITDLNPLRYGLLFERFLNPERVSMPDFDIDFCQDRRDEVISYVQKRYGRDRVAQIITFGKLQARAVLRDVGRVLQMPYGQVDRICKLVPNNPAAPVTLKQAIESEPLLKQAMRDEEGVSKLVDIALKLEGLNRHASTHAAGLVIGDRPLDELVALYRDPKSDMPVVQYSMKYAESAGLVKFDFLGLKTLSVLVRAVELVRKKGVDLDLSKFPLDDSKTYALLGKGDSVGVFQLESAGMRDTLKKLKPDSIEDIIALVSLYRPGPMDNIPTYIARKHGKEKPNYLHPKLETVLKETFGVIIYQEQVMQIAQILAGYSLGEADILRRAMGKKIKSEMDAQRGIFVKKAVQNGVDKEQAAGIFDLIAKFAEYGFNKSHAAAYALIAYQTAYMKANHTVEFLAASMHYDMHNTDKLGVFTEEAARAGIKLLPPDVNKSGVSFEVENGNIRYALAAVRNVGAAAMQAVVDARSQGDIFTSMVDFAARIPAQFLNKRTMEFLIKAGAFDSIHKNRAQLFEGLERIVNHGVMLQEEKVSAQASLFGAVDSSNIAANAPALPNREEWSALEKLACEFEAIGFYISSHPLATYDAKLKHLRVVQAADAAEKLSSQYKPVKLAGIVTGRKFKVSPKGRFAFVQVSDKTGMVEVSVFDETLLNEKRDLLEAGKLIFIEGEGKMDDAGVRFIARRIFALDEYLVTQKEIATKLKIIVGNGSAMGAIRDTLGSANGKGSAVWLDVPVNGDERATIKLPDAYQITPQMIDSLRHIDGVMDAVEEIA
jgi:DNA polymerase-3 subunit alpha